jgi:hypothetical protein
MVYAHEERTRSARSVALLPPSDHPHLPAVRPANPCRARSLPRRAVSGRA